MKLGGWMTIERIGADELLLKLLRVGLEGDRLRWSVERPRGDAESKRDRSLEGSVTTREG